MVININGNITIDGKFLQRGLRGSISKPTQAQLPWYLGSSYSSISPARQTTAVTQSSMSNNAVPIAISLAGLVDV